MKKTTTSLMAGTLALTGALALGSPVFAAEEDYTSITDVTVLKACLEADTDGTCKLGAGVAPTATTDITIPAGKSKVLDLNGHSFLNGTSGEATIYANLASKGNLTIQDTVGGGAVYGSVYAMDGGSLTINSGTFKGDVYESSLASGSTAAPTTITISNGTFEKTVHTNIGTLTIGGGTFNESIYVSSTGSATITGGKFNGTVSASGNGVGKIAAGEFKDTIFCGSDNSSLEITGGTFEHMNCIGYHPGSSLTISGGTFNNGFSIGVETLKITGGLFKNGADNFMMLVLNHPAAQNFSITGGEFINTADEYGYLMSISSAEKLTEETVAKIFEGGNALAGTRISYSGDYNAYVRKARVADGEEEEDDGGSSIHVPDTGYSTKNDEGLSTTSLITIIVSTLLGSAALTAALYFMFHKKVSFTKK